MSWLKEYVTNQIRYQMQDLSSVKIQFKYNERTKKLYIDSRAGLIVYKPKDAKDLSRFRDKWVNKVELLRLAEDRGIDRTEELFELYGEILKNEKVSYEANMNTRLKRSWNSIKSTFRIF